MPRRDLERQLDSIENEVADASETAEHPLREIEHRDADPEARPDGMEYDPEAGRLAYDFWEAQNECLDRLDGGDVDLVAMLGGYRSGKTVTGGRWEITEALRYPGSRWLAMGISYSKASGTTYRTLFENLPGERTHILTSSFNGPEQSPIVADYSRRHHRLTLVNDAVIVLGSADKWSRYAGDEYAGIWLDEPSHYGEELFDILEMMGTRLTAPQGPKKMFWTLTGNGYNSAFSILEQREDKNGDPITLDIDLIRASVLDNPYIDESDKERLRRQFGGTGREEQAILGGFAAAQGLVYSNFSRETHVIPHHEARQRIVEGWRIFGYDSGWRDPRVILELGKTSYDQLVVLDEFHRSESHIEDAIRWLRENDKPQGTIYAETRPEHIEKFRKAGWLAEKANKSIDEGIDEVRKRFSDEENIELRPQKSSRASINRGTPSQLQEQRTQRRYEADQAPTDQTTTDRADDDNGSCVGLLISDRCENLIRELLGYKEEDVGTSRAVDHCCDALRYAVFSSGSGGETNTRERLPLTF